jgi:anti-sigma factor RsiW
MTVFHHRTECREALMDASAALDDELSPFRQRRLERHLSACMPCSATYARMGDATAQLRAHAVECPPAISLPQPVRAARVRRWVAVPAFSAAVVAATVVAVTILAAAPARVGNESIGSAPSDQGQPTLVQLKEIHMRQAMADNLPPLFPRHGEPL